MSNSELLPRTLSLAVHELRTPLAVSAGYIRMLLKEQAGPLNEKQMKMLTEAERACGRLGALVSEMSELGRLESKQLALTQQPFELHGVLTELAVDMHEGRDRGVHIEVTSDGRPLPVLGDRTRMATALGALLHSALRERGLPGAVIADCSTREGNGTRWGVIAIGEEGLIPVLREPGQHPPAFDEWIGGLGMALPLARRVIEAHGGTIWSAADSNSRAASGLRLPLRT
jgi:signal transduction histidine kinase